MNGTRSLFNGATRREFLTQAAGVGMTFGLGTLTAQCAEQQDDAAELPWYRRAYRWGQTNINERDPTRYDIGWWRRYWKQTQVQGLVINAGGIVAYYPSKMPLQYRAQYLGDRDLYGELVRAAHEDGLFVLARMDSNRATGEFYEAHPDWFAVQADGQPYRAGDRYVACIDGPYYEQYLPQVLREIVAWEKPEGFTDNSWSGLDRDQICYCQYSREKFRLATGHELPARKDWDDPVYRQWIKWSYARRIEIWELNNRVTKESGGPDCIWLGMIGGDFVSQGRRLRDVAQLGRRTEMIMLDDQGRSSSIGFQGNAEMGKRLHGLLGWDKLIPESMAMYQRGPTFRKAAATPQEARMWMLSGFAGSIQPWWHHVGAYQWDRRQFRVAAPICQWHAANEQYLFNRQPVASVGVVYSQDNADFYGRDDAGDRVAEPYYGMIQALIRARIPYLPLHADQIDEKSADLALLILPNLAAMSDTQVQAVRRFAERGGGVLASGETSLYDQWGQRRDDFALADLWGAHAGGNPSAASIRGGRLGGNHTYLRLLPDVGKDIDGPLSGDEPDASLPRHPVLAGFQHTDILPFGGRLEPVRVVQGTTVPATFIPNFPIYPPETSWMRQPRTDIAALVLTEREGRGRCAYLPADLDRRFARNNLPDHGALLANLIRWTARDSVPLDVDGTGLVDCHLYTQPGRLILHLVNLTSSGAWRSPVHELIPIGPLTVRLNVPGDVSPRQLKLLVAERTLPISVDDHWTKFEIASILDHEVACIE